MESVTCRVCGFASENIGTCPNCGSMLPERVTPGVGPSASAAPPAIENDPFAASIVSVTVRVSGVNGSREIALRPGDTLVIGSGTGPLQDLCTDNISRYHADIAVTPHDVRVTDRGSNCNGSTNGTFVDGRRLEPLTPVSLHNETNLTLAKDPPLSLVIGISRT